MRKEGVKPLYWYIGAALGLVWVVGLSLYGILGGFASVYVIPVLYSVNSYSLLVFAGLMGAVLLTRRPKIAIAVAMFGAIVYDMQWTIVTQFRGSMTNVYPQFSLFVWAFWGVGFILSILALRGVLRFSMGLPIWFYFAAAGEWTPQTANPIIPGVPGQVWLEVPLAAVLFWMVRPLKKGLGAHDCNIWPWTTLQEWENRSKGGDPA